MHDQSATTAFLALGANLGDRIATLQGARQMLHQLPGCHVTGASALYETAPVGGPKEQPPYLNAVLRIQTRLQASDLLARGFDIERHFGRRRETHWGPRTLDIDLLFYGHEISRCPDLTLPHPRLHQRAFVLVPMLELAPELIDPLSGQTIREMLSSLPSTTGVHRLTDQW